MRICERALNHVQVIDEEGTVRICGWEHDRGIIGRLSQNSMEEIYNSEEARLIRKMHFEKDYSNCNPNACPYVTDNSVDEHSIDVDEVPRLPQKLFLAYENVCNYHCVTCTIPDCMTSNRDRQAELERKYDKIDEEIRKVLPYVKVLGANGQGEFFVSRHIMKLMNEWEPVANPSECWVHIETNGSLFNERNWEKIRNLRRFNIAVAITVMSFDEGTYQELSGTKLPVSNIEDNLRFVRYLRETGAIKSLELATVYQLGNFRSLSGFTRRCIEEFGADSVRLRPYEPWVDPGIDEWMKDVRNSDNPNHVEFLEVMRDPIFKHPKVHDWGGGLESGLGKQIYPKAMGQFKIIDRIMNIDCFADKVRDYLGTDRVVVYAFTTLGKFLVNVLQNVVEIPYLLDRDHAGESYNGLVIHGVTNMSDLDKNVAVIISLTTKSGDFVRKMLAAAGYSKGITKLSELVDAISLIQQD